jgi:chromosome segregation ATPase
MSTRSIEELRDELRQIDADLVRLVEQEVEAKHGIDGLALQARRGDMNAEKQIGDLEAACTSSAVNRRRLKAARCSVEAELQMVLANAEREATKEKAREAKRLLAIFRERGAGIEAGLRKVLADYHGIQADMATLGRVLINSAL